MDASRTYNYALTTITYINSKNYLINLSILNFKKLLIDINYK